jgi:flavin reductase (DIM6/NTAB) family NADH-FMN oxidoreductase RutF
MTTLRFNAFAGHMLEAESFGQNEGPVVLMVSTATDEPSVAVGVREALVQAGRQVIALSLRERADAVVHAGDLQAVLAQLPSRPIILSFQGGADHVAQSLHGQLVPSVGGVIIIGAADAGDEDHSFGVPTLAVPAEQDDAEQGEDHILGPIIAFLEAHQPARPYEFREGSDTRTLRDAMGCFATGVTVVTMIDDQGTPIGLTANSFTSVSLDPPLLLVCIANTSGSAPALRKSDRFGVNVLQIGQQQTSNRFASKAEDRFANIPWAAGETGIPLLDHSLVSFECERDQMIEAGDHFLLIGRVVRAQFEPHRDPLLFFRGKYRRMHFA